MDLDISEIDISGNRCSLCDVCACDSNCCLGGFFTSKKKVKIVKMEVVHNNQIKQYLLCKCCLKNIDAIKSL